jgi:hypothetical protein
MVRCKIERPWQPAERILTLPSSRKGTPHSERRLPMELTSTVTAIMALISFGFLAAIILGMI